MRPPNTVLCLTSSGHLKRSLPVKHSCLMSTLGGSLVPLMLHTSKLQLQVCTPFNALPLIRALGLGGCIDLRNLDLILPFASRNFNDRVCHKFLFLSTRGRGSRRDSRCSCGCPQRIT